VGRKPDPARRAELLAAVCAYLEEHGLAGLSLRPLGAAVGVSPRTLLYHFGSKERLLAEALRVSPALEAAVTELVASDEPVLDRFRGLWARTADPAARPYLRLFFEVYAAGLRDPERYAAFLDGVVGEWLALAAPMLEAEGLSASSATTLGTELIALHHGCALDLLATGDGERVTTAYLARVAELEVSVSRARGGAASP
jgi:AcrR family transcriptional regulator